MLQGNDFPAEANHWISLLAMSDSEDMFFAILDALSTESDGTDEVFTSRSHDPSERVKDRSIEVELRHSGGLCV